MFKIAVVDDDIIFLKSIKNNIDRFSDETKEEFSVICFSDGDEIASDYKPIYDIIFLDIDMKRLNGMSTAEHIRKYDKSVIIIFITNLAQYAIKGYSVDALDFLLKPVPYFAFSELLKRLLERLKLKEKNYLLIPIENGMVKIDVKNILFIESMKHKMIIHTQEKSYELSTSMKEIEDRLKKWNFFRCNNCYLINLACISGIKDNFVIVERYTLQISRPRKKNFLEALTSYVGKAR